MLDINDITLRFGGRLLFNAASAHISDGQKVGLTGRNGTGKTTLFRLICGDFMAFGHADIAVVRG
ncbi:MAG: ATP-binding cassette domain-containing protein [Alphaproteobacteria bacterium]|nr:ATP-binding cassette domain-containing protein [Alphaproteobacteria bacterium]